MVFGLHRIFAGRGRALTITRPRRRRWPRSSCARSLAISGVNRDRRAAIAIDPVAAQVVAGTWTMPKAGDSVTVRPGSKPELGDRQGRSGRLVFRSRDSAAATLPRQSTRATTR